MPPTIRSGRCDECRRRKKKCNERRPSCSLCLASLINCVYSNDITAFKFVHDSRPAQPRMGYLEPIEQNVSLTLRSSWHLPAGSGLYQTFTTSQRKRQRKLPSGQQPYAASHPAPSMPMSDSARLSSEYVFLLGLDATDQNCSWLWQHWSAFIPSRVGSSRLLDCAIACVLETYRAYRMLDARAEESARKRYGQALSMLRDVVQSARSSVTGEVIAATKMLETFETMIGDGMNCWISHANGAAQLFLALGPKSCQKDFERALFYSCYSTVMYQSLLSGRPSPFDTAEWLQTDTPPLAQQFGGDAVESRCRFQLLTKFPRAVNLIRSVHTTPEDTDTVSAAKDLLHDMLDLAWHNATPCGMLTDSPLPESDLAVPPSAIDYPSPSFLNALTSSMSCMTKIMLCGLCESARSVAVYPERLQIGAIRQEELRCALLICKSLSSLLAVPWKLNVAAALFPMRVAWGALWRRESRGCGGSCNDLLSWLEGQIWESGMLLGLKIGREDLIHFTQTLGGSCSA